MTKNSADESHGEVIRPESIGHFGLRTTPDKFEAMVQWHLKFFGARIVLRNDVAAFLAFDDEHHRLVIVSNPQHKINDKVTGTGIYHISFTLGSLAHLATFYEQRKDGGITPDWPVNHGMSTSMYYHDPDGNEFEIQVDNFATAKEAQDFMATEEYARNPIGVDIIPEELIKRIRSGEDEASIKKRPEIGLRQSRWDNSIYFKKEESIWA